MNPTKQFISENKNKIELFHWAVTSGVSTLVYSEFIRRMHQKAFPERIIEIPSLRAVDELLSEDSELMQKINNELISRMLEDPLFQQFLDIEELRIFSKENLEMLDTAFSLVTVPRIKSVLINTITKKFKLDDDTQQLFIQSRSIDLFDRSPIPDDIEYISHEVVLQLLVLAPTIKKNVEVPNDLKQIMINDEDILTIANPNAVAPIHIDTQIMKYTKIMDLLNFVSGTTFKKVDGGDIAAQKNDLIVRYVASTNPFNQATVVQLTHND